MSETVSRIWGRPVGVGDNAQRNQRCWEAIRRLPGLAGVVEELRPIANTSHPVLVTGETGTGKEFFARSICHLSPRASRPFVGVNVGGETSELADSSLFGHRTGAFTGATSDRVGAFASAGDGTLFLDEIGDCQAATQVKLLRVLESGTFRPVGSDYEYQSAARVLAATNIQIDDASRLRQDLRYRIDVLRVHVPPLRQRPEDIPILAQQLISVLEGAPSATSGLSQGAIDVLCADAWPGNTRELRNVLVRCATTRAGQIRAADVQAVIATQRVTPTSVGEADLAELLADALFADAVGDRIPLGGLIQHHGASTALAVRQGSLFTLIPMAVKRAASQYLRRRQDGATEGELRSYTVSSMQSLFGVPTGGGAAFRVACQVAIAEAVQEFKARTD